MKYLALTFLLMVGCSETDTECPTLIPETEMETPVEPVVEPIVESVTLEISQASPKVYYTAKQRWVTMEGQRLPHPFIDIEAELVYEAVDNARWYTIFQNGVEVANHARPSGYTLEYSETGVLADTPPTTFPEIVVVANHPDVTALSEPAEWILR